MQGIGYALMEELRVEDGRVTTLSFGDYKIPTMRDIPPLKTVLLESEGGVGPYHIKGIGESPIGPVAAGDRQRDRGRDRRAHPRPADHGGEGLPGAEGQRRLIRRPPRPLAPRTAVAAPAGP